MPSHKQDNLGKQAAAWLATCFVLAGGALSCITLAVLFLDNPVRPLLQIAGATFGLGLAFWLLRGRRENRARVGLIAWLVRAQDSGNHLVAMRVGKKEKSVPVQFGTNTPPTVQEVRELADDARVWVPRNRRPETTA